MCCKGLTGDSGPKNVFGLGTPASRLYSVGRARPSFVTQSKGDKAISPFKMWCMSKALNIFGGIDAFVTSSNAL